jgi:hypothetical protein
MIRSIVMLRCSCSKTTDVRFLASGAYGQPDDPAWSRNGAVFTPAGERLWTCGDSTHHAQFAELPHRYEEVIES